MCVSPLTMPYPSASSLTGKLFRKVPCGKCPLCVKSKVNSWYFRLEEERKVTYPHYFITLTYDPEHLPRFIERVCQETGEVTLTPCAPTLNKRHLQLFFKKLRFHYDKRCKKSVSPRRYGNQIRYYAVGEYGTKSRRPHYHAILLNMDAVELIQQCWPYGFVSVSRITEGRIKYTLKYISKPRVSVGGAIPEFSLISKKLGKSYLSPQVVRYHTSSIETHSFCVLPGGSKIPLPKYYKDYIYGNSTPERLALSLFMQKRSELVADMLLRRAVRSRPHRSESYLLDMLDFAKINTKFDKRIEVL